MAKIVASIKNVIEGNYITTLFRHVWGGNRMGDFCQDALYGRAPSSPV